MAEPTIQLGGGNWAGKTDNLLGYYKEGERFYKQDFTFSRSTTGTYTDSDGYIQEMPYNLLLQSETFDNASWSKTGVTVTANSVISPNGQTTSDTLVFGASGNEIVQSVGGLIVGDDYTLSIYLKVDSGTTSVTIGNISYVNTFITITSEWQRFEITQAAAATTRFPKIVSTEGVTIYAWGAQLVKGTSAKTYFPTTTRLNMPRVDYLNNSNGSLILEPQRTNNFPNSSDFTIFTVASAGTGTNPTITSNYSISPDGNQNADRIIFDRGTGTTAGDTSYITYSLSLGTIDSTLSIYLKTNDGTTKDVTLRLGAALFDYDVTVTSQWQRFTLNGNTNVDRVQILLYGNQNSQTADLSCYGLQIEQGSYPTTLINTSGSSVTRNADACSITNVAGRIGQTEGAIYSEFKCLDSITNLILWMRNPSGGNYGDMIKLEVNTSNVFRLEIRESNINSANITSSPLIVGDYYKVAIAYKQNDFVVYINGVQIGTDNSGNVPTCSEIYIGKYIDGGIRMADVKDLKLYNTRLSNSELATLTTL